MKRISSPSSNHKLIYEKAIDYSNDKALSILDDQGILAVISIGGVLAVAEWDAFHRPKFKNPDSDFIKIVTQAKSEEVYYTITVNKRQADLKYYIEV